MGQGSSFEEKRTILLVSVSVFCCCCFVLFLFYCIYIVACQAHPALVKQVQCRSVFFNFK